MRVPEPRILKLLTFLTRRQAWLSPPEIAKGFRLEDEPISERTIFRWFGALEEQLGLAYFPYPRMNLLGLADVHVTVRGLRNPAVLATVPWANSFWVQIGLDGQPFLSQDYWIPGPAQKAFHEYWAAAKDLHLVQEADLLPVRNSHFVFSPFHQVITQEGIVEIRDDVDNEYFAGLLRPHLKEPYDVRVGERIVASPLVVPLVLEHLWRHCSSREVWDAIRLKGETHILKHARGPHAKALRKEGRALKLLQDQWADLLRHFNDVFLQPVVFWPPGTLRNASIVSFTVRAESDEQIVDLAMRVSRRSVVTAVMPEAGRSGACRVWCNPPSDQLATVLRLVGEYHRGLKPPLVGVMDLHATRRATHPAFCGFDWQSFDAEASAWRFDSDLYIERLKGIKSTAAAGVSSPLTS
ncbi:MAG TPA: hypothetical protein VJN63_00065 [Thermoplasmata archaeon]|nr:hypothetical protein [Thermoplasmata archaeon]